MKKKLNRTKYLFVAASSLIAASAFPSYALADSLVTASSPGGLVIVNEANGNIWHCTPLISGSSFDPLGQCARIGLISTTSLSGNARINMGTNTTAFVTNSQTAVVVQCSLMASSSGTPLGKCKRIL